MDRNENFHRKNRNKCGLFCIFGLLIGSLLFGVIVLVAYYLLFEKSDFKIWFNKYENGTWKNVTEGNQVCETKSCYELSDKINSTIKWTVDPCEDFYEFACGNWADANPGYSSVFQKEIIKMDQLLQNLLDEENGYTDIERKAQIYYKSCLTAQFRKSKETQLFLAFLKSKIGETWTRWPNTAEFYVDLNKNFDYFYSKVRNQIQYPVDIFKLEREIDLYNSSRSIFRLVPNFLTFPEILEKNFVQFKGERYNIHTSIHVYLHSISNYIDDKAMLDTRVKRSIMDVENFEYKIIDEFLGPNLTNFKTYKSVVNDVESYSYNFTSLDELQKIANFINWTNYFTEEFSKANETIPQNFTIILNGAQYFEKFSKNVESSEITREGRKSLFNYLILRLAKLYKNSNSFCTRTIDQNDSNSDKIGKYCKLTCLRATKSSYLNPALSSLYIRQNFNQNSSEIWRKVGKMFENIQNAFIYEIDHRMYDDLFDGLMLLGVKLKAQNTAAVIGYPEYILELDKIDANLTIDDFIGNTIKLFGETSRQKFRGFFKINDRYQYGEAYSTYSYYSVKLNMAMIPAATLNSDLFNLEYPSSFLYGQVGTSIGHELLHGFGVQGLEFDKDGNFVGPHDEKYMKKFQQRLDCFKKQYPEPSSNDNWINWIEEIISDNGGLQISYRAFKEAERKSRTSSLLPDLNLTPDQIFFISSAQRFCEKYPEIGSSTHPPSKSRVNVPLMNFQEFSDAFECKKGSYLTPVYSDMCHIW